MAWVPIESVFNLDEDFEFSASGTVTYNNSRFVLEDSYPARWGMTLFVQTKLRIVVEHYFAHTNGEGSSGSMYFAAKFSHYLSVWPEYNLAPPTTDPGGWPDGYLEDPPTVTSFEPAEIEIDAPESAEGGQLWIEYEPAAFSSDMMPMTESYSMRIEVWEEAPGAACFWTDLVGVSQVCGEAPGPGPEPARPVAVWTRPQWGGPSLHWNEDTVSWADGVALFSPAIPDRYVDEAVFLDFFGDSETPYTVRTQNLCGGPISPVVGPASLTGSVSSGTCYAPETNYDLARVELVDFDSNPFEEPSDPAFRFAVDMTGNIVPNHNINSSAVGIFLSTPRIPGQHGSARTLVSPGLNFRYADGTQRVVFSVNDRYLEHQGPTVLVIQAPRWPNASNVTYDMDIQTMRAVIPPQRVAGDIALVSLHTYYPDSFDEDFDVPPADGQPVDIVLDVRSRTTWPLDGSAGASSIPDFGVDDEDVLNRLLPGSYMGVVQPPEAPPFTIKLVLHES